MKKDELLVILEDLGAKLSTTGPETWNAVLGNITLRVFTNEAKDRMRIMCAVAFVEDLNTDELLRSLQAGFHSDARYAQNNETLYAVFLHTLSSLSGSDLRVAFGQLVGMVKSAGTSYGCKTMRFQWPRPEQDPKNGIRHKTIKTISLSMRRTSPPKGEDEAENGAGDGAGDGDGDGAGD